MACLLMCGVGGMEGGGEEDIRERGEAVDKFDDVFFIFRFV